MAKKSIIQKEINKKILINKNIEKRKDIINKLKNTILFDNKLILIKNLQKFSLNTSIIRLRNRCSITGRPRGYFRFFKLSRNILREYAYKSLLPGIIKANW